MSDQDPSTPPTSADTPTTGPTRAVGIRRAMPHVVSRSFAASRTFYTEFLGFEEAMDMGWIATFVSPTTPTTQISIVAPDGGSTPPAITVEVADVDAVHAEAVRRDVPIVYPLTDEAWGVRRFFVTDPDGTVINVMSHR